MHERMSAVDTDSKECCIRVGHGIKTKLCILKPKQLKWIKVQKEVVKIYPSLSKFDLNEWHLEYDHGTWVENATDWEIALLYYHHYCSKAPFALRVVIGNDIVGGAQPGSDGKGTDSPLNSPPSKRNKLNNGSDGRRDRGKNALNAVIPPPTNYSIINAMDIVTRNDIGGALSHGMNAEDRKRGYGELEGLWREIVTVLRESRDPAGTTVLSIRRQLPSGTMPKVRKLNKILYEQMRRGNLIRYPPPPNGPNQKPLWSLCRPPR